MKKLISLCMVISCLSFFVACSSPSSSSSTSNIKSVASSTVQSSSTVASTAAAFTPGGSNPAIEQAVFGHKWLAGDNSALYLQADKSFVWYKDDADHENYYQAGTYSVYTAEGAGYYIVNDLSGYGVNQEELLGLFERDGTKSLDNLVCLVLHMEEIIIDGENNLEQPSDAPFFGFFYEGDKALDLANMNTGNYAAFVQDAAL